MAPRPSRRWPLRCVTTSSPVRSTASSGPARPARRVRTNPGVRVSRRRRLDGRLRAAAQAVACRAPRCTASSASRAPSRSGPREYVPKLMEIQRRRSVHPGRLVAGRRAGLRLRDRAQAGRRRRAVRRPHRRGAAGRGDPADQGGDSAPAGTATPGSPSAPSTSRSRRSPTSNSRSSTTRVRCKFVLDIVEPERGADPRRHHRAPAHVVSGPAGDRHRRDPAVRRPRHAVHGRPVPRRRDLLRARVRDPQPDGGWGEFVSELEVVPIGGEHIQAIDEPYIAKVGAHMSEALNRIEAEEKQAK